MTPNEIENRACRLTNHEEVLVEQGTDLNMLEVAGVLGSGVIERCLALGAVVLWKKGQRLESRKITTRSLDLPRPGLSSQRKSSLVIVRSARINLYGYGYQYLF